MLENINFSPSYWIGWICGLILIICVGLTFFILLIYPLEEFRFVYPSIMDRSSNYIIIEANTIIWILVGFGLISYAGNFVDQQIFRQSIFIVVCFLFGLYFTIRGIIESFFIRRFLVIIILFFFFLTSL